VKNNWIGVLMLALLILVPTNVQAQTNTLKITLTRPGEGETLYASASGPFVGIPVSGFVSAEHVSLNQLQVRLETIQNGKSNGSTSTTPRADGTFVFDVGVNDNESTNQVEAEQGCSSSCHSSQHFILPVGRFTLRATVVDPLGNKAVTERSLTVDRSGYVDVPVQVVMEGESQREVEGLTVIGKTRLLTWRARDYSAKTDASGRAVIHVERLAQSSTQYTIQIDPRIVNGKMAISPTPIQVTLPPGVTQVAPVKLVAQYQPGRIQGTWDAKGIQNQSNVTVRAIALENGLAYTAKMAQGKFTLPNLPLSKFLLAADDAELASQRLTADPQTIDLSDASLVTATIKLANSARTTRGVIRDNTGKPLPFAWLVNDRRDKVVRVAPVSGEFVMNGLADDNRALWVTAPGYWSQPVAFGDKLDVMLTPRSDTRTIAWGNGSISVPIQDLVTISGNEISIKRGWIWGKGTGAFTIRTPELEIALQGGAFALEYVVGETNWFYLMEGQAQINELDHNKTLVLSAGQMLASGKGVAAPAPVPLDESVVRAIHVGEKAQVSIETDSEMTARLHDEIERRGIPVGWVMAISGLTIALLVVGIGWKIRHI
jgi:hypothetical protein